MTKIEVFEELEQLTCDPEHMPQVKELLPSMLFLDDSTKRIESARRQYAGKYILTVVTTAKECLRYLCRQQWDVLSLDHDLGGIDFQDPDDNTSGMEVARYIARTGWPINQFKIPTVWIHSSNLFAANLMIHTLLVGGVHAYYRRFEYDDDTEKKDDGRKSQEVKPINVGWIWVEINECDVCHERGKFVNKDTKCHSCYERELIQCS